MKRTKLILPLVAISIFISGAKSFAAEIPAKVMESESRLLNFSISPTKLVLAGVLNGQLQFPVSETISLGPILSFSSYTAKRDLGANGPATWNSATTTSFGLGANAVFNLGHKNFTDGWFITPHVGFSHLSRKLSNNLVDASVAGFSLSSTVGYGWFWANGINLSTEGGLSYFKSSSDRTLQELGSLMRSSGVYPTFALNLGYSF